VVAQERGVAKTDLPCGVPVLGYDRPREIPGSHYDPPANANDLWSRITSGWGVV